MTQPQTRADVFVICGNHACRFPIGGMLVRDARRLVQGLIEIDPDCVAVVDGTLAGDETLIPENAHVLSFIRPSAVIGPSPARPRKAAPPADADQATESQRDQP